MRPDLAAGEPTVNTYTEAEVRSVINRAAVDLIEAREGSDVAVINLLVDVALRYLTGEAECVVDVLEDCRPTAQPLRLYDLNGQPFGPDGGLVVCSECGGTYPNECPDLCGTMGGSITSGPPSPRRRPFRIGPDGWVAK